MKEIIEKLIQIEKATSKEKGEYELFGLFLRENSSSKWDLLVSANWILNDKEKALKYLAEKLQNILSPQELLSISRIVIIEQNNPALPSLQQAIHVEHGTAEIRASNFFGLNIQHAYLITSRRRAA
jgi:hypothetical protein